MTEIYSYTSNIAKLFKHMDKLQALQNGKVSPIMVHVIPTHKCQLNCLHCCFKNRENRYADMSLDVWKTAIDQLYKIGVNSLEFTGGGDPMMWPYINEASNFSYDMGFSMGMITNGIGIANIKNWNQFDWVRVSLNTLDYRDTLDIELVKKSDVDVSFCYIWNELSNKKIDKIIEFANYHKIPCRLAPDCITSLDKIQDQINHIKLVLESFKDNKYVLLSDFNIDLYRENNDCRIHMIKPCLYLDGWLYACPSAELAMENNKQICDKVKICKYNDIERFYNSDEAIKKREYDCSYCKYVKQQTILEALLMETKHNAFA